MDQALSNEPPQRWKLGRLATNRQAPRFPKLLRGDARTDTATRRPSFPACSFHKLAGRRVLEIGVGNGSTPWKWPTWGRIRRPDITKTTSI